MDLLENFSANSRKNSLPGNSIVVCFQHLYFSLMQPEKRRTDAHYLSNISSRVCKMLKAQHKLFHTSLEANLTEKRKSKTLLVKQEVSVLYFF